MSSTVASSSLTFEEFERLPDPPAGRYELLRGELIHVPPPKAFHSDIQDAMFDWLNARLEANWKRRIEFACLLDRSNYLVADIGVTTMERWKSGRLNGYFQGAPELAVEVISESNTASEIVEKTSRYFEHGAHECWVIDPENKRVTVQSIDQPSRRYSPGDSIPLTRFGIEELLPVTLLFASI